MSRQARGSSWTSARARIAPTQKEGGKRALANRLAVAPPAVDVHPLAALTVEVRRDGTVLIRKLSCREVRP